MTSTITGSDLLRIEAICDRFEQDRRSGKPHELEKYAAYSGADRKQVGLIKELLKVEWDLRAERGNPPELSEYATQQLLPQPLLEQVFRDWSENDPNGTLAHFRLLEKLGAGAFGVVWRAVDTRLNREVALKIAHLSLKEDSARFFRESKTAAALNHPNIVRILDAGKLDDRFFITRELVDGQSLSEFLKQNKITPFTAAKICLKIAEALDYSHAAGCVHRDIKPQNILLDENLEPYLTDFGLAKSETAQTTETRSGTILGTPVYMSPEQARGTGSDFDGRMDIYSLGVVLFQMLTGETPFRGNFEMVLLQVIQSDPPSPRKLNPEIPIDLATICLKCMEKDPRKRYPSAAELASDLNLFVNEKPISANPIGRLERIQRTAQRNPVASLLVGILIVLTLVILFGSIMAAVKFRNAWKQEIKLRQQADQATLLAEQSADLAYTEAKLATDVTGFLNSVFSQSDFLGTHLTSKSPVLFGRSEATAGQLLDRAATRIESELASQPRVQARLMDIIGNVYRSIGKLNEAENLFQSATLIRTELKRDNNKVDLSLDEATHDFFVGQWHKIRGDFELAKQKLASAHQRFNDLLPSSDLRISEAIFQLGWLFLEAKDPESARVYFNQALAHRLKHLPENERAINSCRVALIFCDFNDENLNFRSLIQRGRQMFPDEKTSQLFGDILVMMTARKAKLYRIAENKYKRIVELLADRLGRSDPLYLLVLGDYADLLYHSGKYREAFPTIMPAIEVGERVAPDNPHLLEAYRTIGKELAAAGRHDESIRYLQKVAENPKLSLHQRRECKYVLIESLLELDRAEEARNWFDEPEDIQGLELMSWRAWLGCRIAMAQGDVAAEQKFRKRLEDYLPNIQRQRQAASWMIRYGDINRFLGHFETAEQDYQIALKKEKRNQPRRHPRIGIALLRLAELAALPEYASPDKRAKVLQYATESLKIFEEKLPPEDLRTRAARELLREWGSEKSPIGHER